MEDRAAVAGSYAPLSLTRRYCSPNNSADSPLQECFSETCQCIKNWRITLCVLLLGASIVVCREIFNTEFQDADAFKPSIPENQKFAVMIPTFRRNHVMFRSVNHYVTCPSVERVYVIWDDPQNEAPDIPFHTANHAPVEYLKYPSPSLNNRFITPPNLNTEAILSIDDDVIVECSDLDFAFMTWLTQPDAIVGFYPRLHSATKGDGDFRYEYLSWRSVWHTGLYSIVLTKGSFMHRKWLTAYEQTLPSTIKEFITTNHNCEDIAMNFLVSSITNKPPLWVSVPTRELAVTGISSSGNHDSLRSRCIQLFSETFGSNPLVLSSVKVARIPTVCTHLARIFSTQASIWCASV